MIFYPSSTSHRGLFTYIKQKHGYINSSLVTIKGTVRDSGMNIFAAIDDTYNDRYVSSETPNPSLIIEFISFPINITHYSFHFAPSWYYMRDWKISRMYQGKEYLLSEGSARKDCVTDYHCANDVYIVKEIANPVVVDKIKIQQTTKRSNGDDFMEFKSFEVYGRLIVRTSQYKGFIKNKVAIVMISFIILLIV